MAKRGGSGKRRDTGTGAVSFDLNMDIDGATQSMVDAAHAALLDTAKQAASIARRTTAVKDKSGHMRKSIKAGETKRGAYVLIGFPGSFHEFGTGPRETQSGAKRGKLPIRPIVRPAVKQALAGLPGRLTNSVK